MFNPFKKTYKLVTHNGKYHADDIFACAILQLVLDKEGKQYKIIRTRDKEIIEKGDYVFDIGGIDDSNILRFDHHQKGGGGARDNGIPYAACGLVWREYGAFLSGSVTVAKRVEQKLIQQIDADDNGYKLIDLKYDVAPYRVQEFFYAFRLTWKEDNMCYDKVFKKLVPYAKQLLEREIVIARDSQEAMSLAREIYDNSEDKKIIISDKNLPFEELLITYPEPVFVVKPRPDGQWGLNTIPKAFFSSENRKNLPANWGGCRDGDLANITGVKDAIFCHNGLFLATAKSKQGAIELAQLALNN